VAVVGAIVIAVARRMLHRGASSADAGFTLHDLRRMRDAGELSDEEFERARAALIGRVRGIAQPSEQASENPRGAERDTPSESAGGSDSA